MTARPAQRNAFTLVEMLVVVIIIGILMTLVTPAVMNVLRGAKDSVTTAEQANMQASMYNFMQSNGVTVWPPCDLRMANASDVNKPIFLYFRRMFPRYNAAGNLYNDLQTAGVNTTTFDPGHALIFWLVGFNPDPENPLSGHAARMAGTDITQRHFPFDADRLINKHYLARNSPGTAWFDDANANSTFDAGEKIRAYLYFDNASYGTAYTTFNPYKDFTTTAFYNRDSCQIISPGKDSLLGVGGAPVSANAPYTGADSDNVANFGEGRNMRDFIEKKKP